MPTRLGKGDHFIMDMDNRDALLFQHFSDEISDNTTPNWASVDIIGRSAPYRSWSNTGPRTLSLELTFVASIETADLLSSSQRDQRLTKNQQPYLNGVPQNLDFSIDSPTTQFAVDQNSPELVEIIAKVDFCRSLVYPNYSDPLGRPGLTGDFAFPPPKVLVYIGSFMRLVAITTSVDITWKRPYSKNGIPIVASANLSFEAINAVPFGKMDVRRGEDVELSITSIGVFGGR